MSTQIGDLIFESGKTLFEVLDSLDIAQVSTQLENVGERLSEVDDQLRQLGSIVDTNQSNNNASFISVNTKLDSLDSTVARLASEFEPISSQITQLTNEVANLGDFIVENDNSIRILRSEVDSLFEDVQILTDRVSGFNNRITQLETRTSQNSFRLDTVQNQVTLLEATKDRNQFVRQGNEYIFSYRLGNPGTTSHYRIAYKSGNQIIKSNVGYEASVFNSTNGTVSDRTTYIAAPFDVFTISGRENYQMIQGPCALSFTNNNTSPIQGYLTIV